MSELQTNLLIQDDGLVVRQEQQCTPIAELTTALHNEGVTGSADMKWAARIPDIFIEDYCIRNKITYEEWCSNKEHVKALVNDPALAAFRIWKGRV